MLQKSLPSSFKFAESTAKRFFAEMHLADMNMQVERSRTAEVAEFASEGLCPMMNLQFVSLKLIHRYEPVTKQEKESSMCNTFL
jgi:hypothetical protein